jgi:uncharacterized spore protein YtfJ
VRILEQVKELVGGTTVYDAPYEKDGMTIIAASRVMGGGGAGGGVGLDARPAGAFVIKGDDVSWIPAMDINRIVLGAQLVAIVAFLSWRSVAKARARARR